MLRLISALVVMVLFPALLAANPQERAKFVAPFLDEQTFLICRMDVTRIDVEQAFRQVQPLIQGFEEQSRSLKEQVQTWIAEFRAAGGKEVYVCVSLEMLPAGDSPCLLLPFTEGMKLGKLEALLKNNPTDEACVIHGAWVIGPASQVARLKTHQALPRPEVAAAFAAAGDGALQVLFVPPDYFRRVIEENLPTLPAQVGGGSSQLLTKGVRWAVLTADLSPELRIQFTFQSQDAAAAQRLKEWLPAFFQNLGREREVHEYLPNFPQLMATLTPALKGEQLQLHLDVPQFSAQWSQVLPHFRLRLDESVSQSNLRQLCIAMHQYHSDFNRLPLHAIYSKDGKPLLSWRVAILPYLGHRDLFQQFKLDEPWDSDHNKKLLPQMPKVFAVPGTSGPVGSTNYQVVVTPATYKGKYATVFRAAPDAYLTLGRITNRDGTSNTILIVEAAKAVPWTKPEDVELPNDDQPLPAFGAKLAAKRFSTVYADGTTRLLRKLPDSDERYQRVMRQLLGYDDGGVEDLSGVLDPPK